MNISGSEANTAVYLHGNVACSVVKSLPDKLLVIAAKQTCAFKVLIYLKLASSESEISKNSENDNIADDTGNHRTIIRPNIVLCR